MNLEFRYKIGDDVLITKLKVIGSIVGLYYGETGKQYQTVYYLNGDRKIVYFYENELDFSKDVDKFGFNVKS